LAAALVSAWSAELLPPTALGGARGAEAAEGPLLADERRNVIITGCNSGIGLNGAAKLAALGYNVTLACRTMAKAEGAKAEIEAVLAANGKAASAGTLTAAECDLGVLASVRSFASAWNATGAPLDVLVCNAGVQVGAPNMLWVCVSLVESQETPSRMPTSEAAVGGAGGSFQATTTYAVQTTALRSRCVSNAVQLR
jgi:NAD(P)-dependent dehydrogenase (short-subunit alcohol dehydrogenase family)